MICLGKLSDHILRKTGAHESRENWREHQALTVWFATASEYISMLISGSAPTLVMRSCQEEEQTYDPSTKHQATLHNIPCPGPLFHSRTPQDVHILDTIEACWQYEAQWSHALSNNSRASDLRELSQSNCWDSHPIPGIVAGTMCPSLLCHWSSLLGRSWTNLPRSHWIRSKGHGNRPSRRS